MIEQATLRPTALGVARSARTRGCRTRGARYHAHAAHARGQHRGEDVSEGTELVGRDCVDPDIRRFVDLVNAAYQELSDGSTDLPSRRRVAELVREPWRADGPAMHDIRDLTVGGCRVRIYKPVAATDLPAMLYVHGGGWMLFSIDTHDRLMREYAARAGVAVIGLDYSLSPEHKYPVALEEVYAGIEWLIDHASMLGIDPTRLLVGGDSAGANLCVAVSLLRRERGKPGLAGMVLSYGAFDPEPSISYTQFGGPEFPLLEEEMHAFWHNYVDRTEQLSDPLVVPIKADLHDLPPAFVAIAECDILADCNRRFAEKLRAAGVPTTTVTYRGATHSFLEAMSISPLAITAIEDQAEWMRAQVGR